MDTPDEVDLEDMILTEMARLLTGPCLGFSVEHALDSWKNANTGRGNGLELVVRDIDGRKDTALSSHAKTPADKCAVAVWALRVIRAAFRAQAKFNSSFDV